MNKGAFTLSLRVLVQCSPFANVLVRKPALSTYVYSPEPRSFAVSSMQGAWVRG